jgi:soluble lytic murein transglycosylase-like protein
MAWGVRFFKEASITISRPLTFFFILIYLAQSLGIGYLVYDRFEKIQLIKEQQKRIAELEDKVKILKIIEDFNVGLNEKKEKELASVIYAESKKYGYDPLLLIALIMTESSFRTNQESLMGALGLMQIKPSTGSDLAKRRGIEWKGGESLFEPAYNIKLGSLYLFELIVKFKDVKKALVAYNVGEETMHLRLKSGETLPKFFLSKVTKNYKELKKKYEKSV